MCLCRTKWGIKLEINVVTLGNTVVIKWRHIFFPPSTFEEFSLSLVEHVSSNSTDNMPGL